MNRKNIDGLINVYKPKGRTSFYVVNKLKKELNVKKIGHTGTLDPLAEGVLVVCIGEATKIAGIISDSKKTYYAKVLFGIETETYDMEGNVIREKECKDISKNIEDILGEFIGEISQVPPMYSAVSYKGERLYKIARRGETIERKPRKVKIYKLSFLDYKEINKYAEISLLIECSKGTYIRSLAHDIGKRIGCPAVLSYLRREKVGNFSIENSLTIDEIVRLNNNKQLNERIIGIKDALSNFIHINVDIEDKDRIRNGQSIYLPYSKDLLKEGFGLVLCKDIPIAIGKIEKKNKNEYLFRPKRIFNI